MSIKYTSQQENLDTIAKKGTCIEVFSAYQDLDIHRMLNLCDVEGTISFEPLGENFKGKIHEIGRVVWSSLMDAFPDLDNTVKAQHYHEADNSVLCNVVIYGTQEKDFASIPSKGNQFNSDHIFIFHFNENGNAHALTYGEHIHLPSRDDQFLLKLDEAIEKNISDSNFDVEELTREIGVSRMQIHRKLKTLTNFSTTEYIRNYRLRKGADMLKSKSLTISEIAYEVGFSKHAYFSESFKKLYKVSPLEFQRSHLNKNAPFKENDTL